MARVLAIGYPVPTLVAGQPDVRTFPGGLGRDDVGPLADELLATEDTLVVQPAWDVEPDLLRLQTVRAVLETNRVAVYATALPPLAGGVLCALTAALAASGVPAGELWAALPALERQLLTVARLGRVDRLARPRPSVGARLASWLPATTFAMSSWPRPHVRRLRSADGGVAIPPGLVWGGLPLRGLAVAAEEDGGLRWIEEVVLPLLGAVDIVEVDAPPLSSRFWGTRGVTEAAAFPVDLSALRGVVQEATASTVCHWCGTRIASSLCPFCGSEVPTPMLAR